MERGGKRDGWLSVASTAADGGAKFDPSATPPGDAPLTSMIRVTEDDPRANTNAGLGGAICCPAKERWTKMISQIDSDLIIIIVIFISSLL